MIISYNHQQAKIEECTPAERVVVKDLLTVWVKDAQFTKAYEEKRWDGYRRFLTSWGTFPSGLLKVVKKHMEGEGYRVKLINESPRHPRLRANYDLKDIELYDFQQMAVFRALKEKRGILRGITASGKTESGIAIANSILKNPIRPFSGIWLTHSRPLMWQTKERFKKRLPGLNIGVIGDGHYQPGQLTIAIPNSLSKRLKVKNKTEKRKFEDWLGRMILVVLDEAHLMNDMWREPLSRCYSALFKLALTATPLLKDDDSENFDLVGATGSIFYQVTARDLIDRGLIAEPHIWFLEYDGGPEIPSRAHWSTIYAEGIVNNTPRNERICSVARDFGLKGISTLILVEQVDHGQMLASSLSKILGFKVGFVSGKSSTKARAKAIHDLKTKERPVLVATTVFDAGIDVPAIGTIILGGGKKSSIRTYQRIGRGMRKEKGKEIVKVFDFWDRNNSLLQKHSRQRYDDCQAEEGYVMEGRHWNGS